MTWYFGTKTKPVPGGARSFPEGARLWMRGPRAFKGRDPALPVQSGLELELSEI